jgi:hypothetical protein
MERFEGNHGLAVILGFTGLLMLCFVAWLVCHVVVEANTFTLVMASVVIYCMGGVSAAGLFVLWFAREIGASFVLDDQAITRHAWGQTTVLQWREIVRFNELNAIGFKGPSNMFGRLFLYGSDGRRVTIRYHLLPDGSQLRARLEPRLAPLRDAELREIAKHGRSFRTERTTGILVMTCMVPMFLFGGLGGLDRAKNGSPVHKNGLECISLMFIGASPLLAILGSELISRRLILTSNALELRSLFLRRSIPFSRVESIDVKTNQSDEGFGFERAKIRAEDGQSITLESTMPGYRPVLELLRKHVDAKAHVYQLPDPELA